MELITTLPQTKRLEQAIEELHQQSLTWLSKLHFWKDEKLFFNELLNNRLLDKASPFDRNVIRETLWSAGPDDLELLLAEVTSHENYLGKILTSGNPEERDYRENHRKLGLRMISLEEKFKLVKRAVIELVKTSKAGFFNTNETLSIISERRSVRKYKADVPERLLVEQLLRAAAMAPSAMNTQPWKFYVLSNNDKIKKYSKEIEKITRKLFRFELNGMPHEEDPIFHGAPLVIFITASDNNEWASMDIGMCAQNLMLAAKSLGLDTCPVGLARFIKDTPVYDQLGIPSTENVQLAVVLGFGDEKPVLHERISNNVKFLS